MAVSLVFETHSISTDNEAGRATGWAPGELSPRGVELARELGRRRGDDGFDLVLSSDLHRAMQTVEVAFAGSDVPRSTDVRLREVDYGELTLAPVERIDAERLDHVDVPFPGGQSYRDVVDGVRGLLDELARDRDGQRLLLVGHAATRYALDHLLAGRPLETAVVAPFAWREGWTYRLTAERPSVAVLDGPAALGIADDVERVYRAAFGAPGYDETDDDVRRFMAETLPTHASRAGFRMVTLRLGPDLLGFAYGYTGERGQWWTDNVAGGVPAAVDQGWFGGHFEVVELAVDPAAQGRGFGAALMDHLLLGLPHDRALLSTYRDDRPAPRLYARLGWTRLATGVLDGGSDLWGKPFAFS
jgi:broad specificity phosphatase PhoE/GNAT superfamily N-acetyltransferase